MCASFNQSHPFLMQLSKIPESRSIISDWMEYFYDDNYSWDFLLEVLYHSKPPQCRRCRKDYRLCKSDSRNSRFFRCQKCRREVSSLTGTTFSQTHLKIGQVLHILLNFWLRIPILQTSMQYNVSRDTVAFYFSIARASQASRLSEKIAPLGGPGVTVEIDEAILRKRKFNKGRKKPQIWIFGAAERPTSGESGRFWMIRVPNRKAETLIPLIQANIIPGSIIISDEWRAYASLSKLGYTHQTVCHKRTFKDPLTGACTNRIEGLWGEFRRSLPSTGIKDKFIDDYIATFISRKIDSISFELFVKTVGFYTVPYNVAEETPIEDDPDEEDDDVPLLEQPEPEDDESDGVGDGLDESEYEEI